MTSVLTSALRHQRHARAPASELRSALLNETSRLNVCQKRIDDIRRENDKQKRSIGGK